MEKELVIIKLGGSVITDKQSLWSSASPAGLKQSFSANKSKSRGVFRKAVVRRLVREIVEAKKKKDFDLILVHGAGSFGHPIAKKYKLTEGYLSPESSRGFALCKKAMFELSLLVWEELTKTGINASIVQPSAIITTSDKKIKTFSTEFIKELLSKNITPVLFGDVVLDDKQGFCLLSGDVIVSVLAKKLRAEKIIFVVDVAGVFNKNPQVYKDAKLVKEVNKSNYQKIIKIFEASGREDVTLEMKGKILAIRQDLMGYNVELISGLIPFTLRDTIDGKSVGTRFLF